MAERSFKKEVEQLKIPAGEEFRGEGILAITKGLLEAGVGYVGGYQGSPISHLMDVLADANEVLEELGVHFETSASEATAAAMLAASVMYPIRGAVTWKSTAGTNVASDALANLTSGGVTGGALIIVGEDYGEGSSIMQERSHAFAMKSQIWLLDPRPSLDSLVKAVSDGFELSEASQTPVMLQLRIRSCHAHGRFITKPNQRPTFTLKQALANPVRDVSRIVLPPSSFLHEQEKIKNRWPAAIHFIQEKGLNEVFVGEFPEIGLILQGGLFNGVIRALQQLGLADSYGNSRISIYVMNVTYPVIPDEVINFCRDKRAVLLLEEGQPDYLEQNLHTILRKASVSTQLSGKDLLPMAGEYSTQVMMTGIKAFLNTWQEKSLTVQMPQIAQFFQSRQDIQNTQGPSSSIAATSIALKPTVTERPITFHPKVQAASAVVPARPAGFCVGCPERPIFAAMKLVENNLGPHHTSCDIGCHLFSILPPFNLGATTMGYGLGASSSSAFNVKSGKRSISIMGDGGFWHNGLTSGISNAVFNKNDGVIIIVDNFYSAATGGQDIPSSRAQNFKRTTNNPIVDAIRGVGVQWVRVIDHTYDVARMRDTLEEALTTTTEGPKVIVAQSECMLNKQRRLKPLFAKSAKAGKRVVKERFGVDPDVCSGDHACVRLSGCPSLTVVKSADPLKEDPVAYVDNTCVACGNCGEVAEAAALCPSFYRADLIYNPSLFDRISIGLSASVIRFLQARRSASLRCVTL